MYQRKLALDLKMLLALMAVVAISLAAGKQNMLIGIGMFSTGVFWCLGIAYRLSVNPILLAVSISFVVSFLGGMYGFLRSCFPFENENMLFGPISSFVFVFLAFAVTSAGWLVASVLIWLIILPFSKRGRQL